MDFSVSNFETWLVNQPRDYRSVFRKFLPLLHDEERSDIRKLTEQSVISSILDRFVGTLPFSLSSRITYESKFRSPVFRFIREQSEGIVIPPSDLERQLSEAWAALAKWPKLRLYLIPGLLQAEKEANHK